MPTRPVDLNNIKARIAEALVESIFRRTEFKMTRFGRESDLRRQTAGSVTTISTLPRFGNSRNVERSRFHGCSIAQIRN
jgi:hypothetical protein